MLYGYGWSLLNLGGVEGRVFLDQQEYGRNVWGQPFFLWQHPSIFERANWKQTKRDYGIYKSVYCGNWEWGAAYDRALPKICRNSWEKSLKKNTTKTTNMCVNRFEAWRRRQNCPKLEEISKDKLNGTFEQFFVEIHKSDGSEYETDSLWTMLSALDRHLWGKRSETFRLPLSRYRVSNCDDYYTFFTQKSVILIWLVKKRGISK